MRTAAEQLDSHGYIRVGRGWDNWLRPLVQPANRLAEQRGEAKPFGAPNELDTDQPGTELVERYDEARIAFKERSVYIIPDSDRVEDLLRAVSSGQLEEVGP